MTLGFHSTQTLLEWELIAVVGVLSPMVEAREEIGKRISAQPMIAEWEIYGIRKNYNPRFAKARRLRTLEGKFARPIFSLTSRHPPSSIRIYVHTEYFLMTQQMRFQGAPSKLATPARAPIAQ